METELWEDALPGGGEALDEYLYIGKTQQSDARVIHIGKSRVSLKNRILYQTGQSYYMLSNVMHRIIYRGDKPSSTLMCHSQEARTWARTITRRDDLPDVTHDYLSAPQLKELLMDYMDGLK